jgi:hypothetical protein
MARDNSTYSANGESTRNHVRYPGQDRGVSDVVSFVLIFSLVIASGAVVATAGLDQLTELRDVERVQSSERAMEVAAADLSNLQGGNQSTNLDFALNGGNIWVNDSYLQVNVSGPGIDSDSINDTYQVNSLEHRLSRGDQDVTVAYESGAVMRSDGGSFQYDPRWQNDTETVILTIVSLREGSESINVAGGGFNQEDAIDPRRGVPQGAPARDPGQMVRIAAESNFTEQQQWYIPLNETQTGVVRVNVSDTANPDQWNRSLEQAGWNSTGAYSYEVNAEEAILIRHVVIELS